ncbi:MAG: [protein-PII] uridylyltransferase [Desulfobulbaceae bacterium]|nr:[protein-PII] uridylyltransferase [Desulfobulbaceae bacterium]
MLAAFRAEREKLQNNWSLRGDAGKVLKAHTKVVDEYIVGSCRGANLAHCEDNVALVAVGGYGRQEMFPASDVDLMILYRPEVKEQITTIADAVLYPLWDTGLDVGHGVRTVEESIKHAGEEYFFLVALLDARLLAGAECLYDDLMAEFRSKYVDGHREEFVLRMKEYRQSRLERFGSHSYLLEPHIKEGRGGMRDIQAMMWTARVVFGLRGIDDFQDAGLLLEEEKEGFLVAQNFLVRLRCHLHYLSKRKNDQLYFEQQEDIAEAFGYKEADGVRAVEYFMMDVYGALQVVTVTTDLFFDHVDEVLGLTGVGGKVSDKAVEKGIEIRGGRIHLTASKSQLNAKPQTLVRVFLAMSRSGLPMHHRSRKNIPAFVSLITDKERCSPRLAKTFFALLFESKDLLTVLGTMLETGVLTAVVPEFQRIIKLAQHDLYHIYTVDRHSLQTVAELHDIVDSWASIVLDIKELKVLYLAALLHDIGKGSGRDHSIEGATAAREVGLRFCFSDAECDSLEFLIQYHLFIPESALRRDLNDAVFIKRCADMIGDVDRLSMLYLLSVADSKATGPSAWSDWKGALMEEFFLKVYPYLDLGRDSVQDVSAHEEQGVEWLREQILVQLAGESNLKVDVDSLGTDYILSFSPEVIAGHVVIQRDRYRRIRQKSFVQAIDCDDSWTLLIMTTDRPGLLAKICGVMALNNLSVTKAQIFTWTDGTVVDVLDVRSTDGLSFAEKDWQDLNDQLDMAIEHRMGLSHRLYAKLASTFGRKSQLVGDVASKVVVDNKSSESFTVIEVYAADLPAQLYYITQGLADFGINIHKAYIATEVEQLIDVFYVLDVDGKKLADEGFIQEITQGVLHSITNSSR